MSEEKMVIPAYVRVGICKECGAHVYAPEGGGMPCMSSCACAGDRKVVSTADGSELLPRRTPDGKMGGKARAA